MVPHVVKVPVIVKLGEKLMKVSHAIVQPLAEQVSMGMLDITGFVDELLRNNMVVVNVEISTTPILDHMSNTVSVYPYIVANIVHSENPAADPVQYALQKPIAIRQQK